MPMELGYWKTRTLAQSMRLVLAYVEAEFKDKRYEVHWDEKNQTWDKSEWFDIKYKLGLPFPNLPYLIDGDIMMTESKAILSYLGRKFNLEGKTEQARVYNDMLLQLVYDAHFKFAVMAYFHYDEQKEDYRKSLPDLLKQFSDFLADKPWFTGDVITVSDFHMYELLDVHKMFDPNCLEQFANLQRFCERFEKLPTIEKYMQSDKFMKAPVNNKYAQFNNV